MYEIYLLDLDGLLIDTEGLHFEAYQSAARAYGFELGWTLGEFKLRAHAAASTLREALQGPLSTSEQGGGWAAFYNAKQMHFQRIVQERAIECMPGARELLISLQEQRARFCVVTNSTSQQVELLRARCCDLSRVQNWIVRENYRRPKPAPDGYLAALRKFRVSPARAIGFEDSLKGLTALMRAGVRGVLICPTPPGEFHQVAPRVRGDWNWHASLLAWLDSQKSRDRNESTATH